MSKYFGDFDGRVCQNDLEPEKDVVPVGVRWKYLTHPNKLISFFVAQLLD